MYVLGVTGNIGSGKSTVSQYLAQLGATVSHSDDLAKSLLEDDTHILQALTHRFGEDILDDAGKLQRSILAERAFSTESGQQFLNQVIHPEVRKQTLIRIESAQQQNCPLFVIDAPLLFEAGVESLCHSVLVVAAQDEYRRDRVNQRSQISAADFKRRDELQLSIEEKIRRGDHVIYNNGSLAELYVQVDQLYQQIMA